MATIDLSQQAEKWAQFEPKLLLVKAAMDQRKPLWDRRTNAQKKAWVEGTLVPDPVMQGMFAMVRYMVRNFPDLVEYAQKVES